MVIRDAALIESFRLKTTDQFSRTETALAKEIKRYSWSPFYEPLLYALEGGKRIRPVILMLASESVGSGNEDSSLVAVAIELLHTESIIHDDIIDDEESRRDRVAFHIKYGNGASLLTADFVFGMILDIASRCENPRIAKELSNAALRMCEGEFLELKMDPTVQRISWDEYIETVSKKTASLFQTAAKMGAIIGGGTDAEIAALSDYGLQLGIGYQIQDDVLDYNKDGKMTKAIIIENEADSNNIAYLRKMSETHAELAKSRLSELRQSTAKESLSELADFSITRSV